MGWLDAFGTKEKYAGLAAIAGAVVQVLCLLFPRLAPVKDALTTIAVGAPLALLAGHAHTDSKVTSAVETAKVAAGWKPGPDGTLVPPGTPSA